MVTYGTFRKVILLLFLSFTIPTQGWGGTWYVRSSSGEYGAENGTSYATAFDGFSGISWGSVNPGDTVYVCGTFTGEYLNISKSGTSGNPVVVDGDCPSDPGVINNNRAGNSGIRVAQNYVTIRNLVVHGIASSQRGINSGSCFNGITIDNVELYDADGDGIVLQGSNMKVLNCNVHDVKHTGIWVPQSGCPSGTTNAEVAYNTVNNIGTAGQNYDGIFVGDGAGTLSMHHNTVTNVVGGGGSSCIDTSNAAGKPSQVVSIYNNLVDGCSTYGIGVGDQDVADSGSIYFNVVLNSAEGIVIRNLGTYTIYNNVTGGSGINAFWFPSAGTRNITMMNNILYGNYTNLLSYNSSGLSVTSDYNNFYKTSTGSGGGYPGQDTHSQNVNPLFVSSTDYHLQAGSPLIDAGTDVGLPSNYGGAAPDIGAGGEIGPGDGGTGTGTGTGSSVPNAPQITGIN